MHVIHHLFIGGMENGLVNLINHLPERDFRHAVVCIDDHSNFAHRIRREDVELIDLRRPVNGVWSVRKALLRLFRERQPQIVHSRGPSGLDAIAPAALAGVPNRVHGEHGWDMQNLEGTNWKLLWLRRVHSPLVNRYVAVSKDIQRYLVDTVGIAEHRITTICNGVDTERFKPGEVTADLGLPDNFLNPGVLRIGTVGRLQEVKSQTTLVAAVAEIVRETPELRQRIRLILVGDGPMRHVLAEQVQASGIDEIVFLTGATDRVADWLHAFDVFVLPSLNEGLSNTLLEGMACGLPVLATPVGGNTELLIDGVTGHFFPVKRVDVLASHLRQYLADPSRRQRQGAAARARAEQDFSLRAMVGQYGALYRELASNRRR